METEIDRIGFQDLGYRVVASSSTAVKQDYNEYMWTMRRLAPDSEPFPSDTASTIERDNLANSGREQQYSKADFPDE